MFCQRDVDDYFHVEFTRIRFQRPMRLVERIVALLPSCSSVCLSLRLSGTGVRCDQMVHFSPDLTLWLDSPD